MSDKAAFVRSVYSRYRAQTSNVNITLFLPVLSVSCWQSEFAFLISPSK